MSKTPSNCIYEKDLNDFARRAIAKKLGVRIIGKRKDAQWHDIVATLVNKIDNYDHMRKCLIDGRLAWDEKRIKQIRKRNK